MDIRRVDFNTYDLFLNNGWDKHTRVRKGRSSTYVLAGERISHALLKDLDRILSPRFPINYGQSFEHTCFNLESLNV